MHEIAGLPLAAVLHLAIAIPVCAHILLTKADKLNRRDAQRVLRETMAACADAAVTVQLFSAHENEGIDEAREVMDRWLQ